MSNSEWGNAAWILFHTLAQQIKEQEFPRQRTKLINFVVQTCSYLPCPVCAQSASAILNRAYLSKIVTKADFIEFVRQFHNIVNNKLHKPIMSVEDIGNKYNMSRLDIVIEHFLRTLSVSYGNMRMLVQSYQRQSYIRTQRPLLYALRNSCRGGSRN